MQALTIRATQGDGMGWDTLERERGVFEVSESFDEPRFREKAISTPDSKTVHRVVLYCAAEGVPSLAGPSRCMIRVLGDSSW